MFQARKSFPSRTGICLPFFVVLVVTSSVASQELFLAKRFDVLKTVNVKYGIGTVHLTSSPVDRDLLLDVYEPTGPDIPALKPGFIFVHGGAWRYGSKESDRFERSAGSGDFSSAVSEYAREFARRGYVCAVIDYRKIQDDPAVRDILSTPPSDISGLAQAIRSSFASQFPVDQVRRGIEAGFDDTVRAIEWMVENAAGLGVDPSRIAVGGWSAGAVNSVLAAYLEGSPVRAVWMNSGGMPDHMFIREASQPAIIIFHGDQDAIASVESLRRMIDRLQSVGVPHQYFEMPGEDHFYRLDRPVTPSGETVEELMAEFLLEHMDLSAMSAVPNLSFLRGDCNADGNVNVADASCALNWMFGGASGPGCLAALNTNGDADVNIADPVALLNFLFGGGPMISAPFPGCGPGTLPADAALGCANPPDCQ